MLVPGMCAWGLVIAGIAMDDTVLLSMGVALFLTGGLLAVVRTLRSSANKRDERKRAWADGRPATARIISIGTRGGGINDHPLVNFELEVVMEGGISYQATTSGIVSKLAIPRIQPECEIVVRVDRNDRSVVVIDEALTPYGY